MLLTLAVLVSLSAAPEVREPKELMAILEKSTRHYEVVSVKSPPRQWSQQALLSMYPRAEATLDEPRLDPDGMIRETVVPDGLEALLQPVEAQFQAKAFAEAERGYERVLAKFPKSYLVTLSWGDAALFDGRPEVALARYRTGQKLNPLDHRGHFYEGTALVALGKPKEALDAYARALARRPHAQFVIEGVDARSQKLGIKLRTTPFLPQARVDERGDGFQVAVADPRWVAWGMCKAAWIGEVEARNVPQPEKRRPTMTEERECLVQLLAVYMTSADRKKRPDPQLEWLVKVQQAGLLQAFIVYELVARMEPHVTLTADPAGLSAIEQYVRTFVFERP